MPESPSSMPRSNRVWTVAVTPTLGAPVGSSQLRAGAQHGARCWSSRVDAVPASIREVGNDYLVSLLTGFPFGPGAASLWRVNRVTGATERIVSGLQTAVDVLPVAGTSDQYYVLEYSRAFLTNGPGRLIRVDGTRGTSLVLADPLQNATSMAFDTRTGDLFVTELQRIGLSEFWCRNNSAGRGLVSEAPSRAVIFSRHSETLLSNPRQSAT